MSFVLGTCVYHIAVQGMMQTMRQVGQNIELPQWTQGFYDAREIAMTRLQAEAERDGATGVVGVSVTTNEWLWGGHTLEFYVSGTSVRRISDAKGELPALVVTDRLTFGGRALSPGERDKVHNHGAAGWFSRGTGDRGPYRVALWRCDDHHSAHYRRARRHQLETL